MLRDGSKRLGLNLIKLKRYLLRRNAKQINLKAINELDNIITKIKVRKFRKEARKDTKKQKKRSCLTYLLISRPCHFIKYLK
jgi:hypothetical protein